MAENLSKKKRDRMISFLEGLKKTHADDASIRAFNEIENQLREKKYGLVWEEHSEEVDDKLKENIPVFCADKKRRLCKDEKLPWNFIIEGDNLQALYLLEKTHKGKVDCIYIDPPYNSGARDWKYNNDYVDGNDAYRHSKWLSMMRSRLAIAKNLLNPENSVLICTIDEKEYMRLGCLLDEMFPDAKIQMISSIIAQKGVARANSFYRTNEFIYIVQLGKSFVVPLTLSSDWSLGNGKNSAAEKGIVWSQLRRSGTSYLRTDSPNLFYPIIFSEDGTKIIEVGNTLKLPEHPSNSVEKKGNRLYLWPIKEDGTECRWQLSQTEFISRFRKGYVKVGKYKGNTIPITYLKAGSIKKIDKHEVKIIGYDEINNTVVVDASNYERSFIPGTQWNIETHDATYHGKQLLNKILINDRFPFPKSLYAVHDTIRFFVANKPNAVIVDFFAGSGTTGHAVNLLNAEDCGERRWIMITNNEISETEEKEFTKMGIKKGEPEWEAKGIAQYVTWPRTVCSIKGKDINDKPLKGNYLESDIPMADGFNANVKYFKCEWTPRKPEDYLLSNALALHVKEMIEIQNAIEIDNKKNVLILNKTDFKNIILDKKKYAQIEHVWVNQNIIFNAKELKLLQEKGYKYIPKEFFGQELREAAE